MMYQQNQVNIHDDMLFSMLNDCKSLHLFFDKIFGFLCRRTDFYCIAKSKSSVGLPEEMAELIVKKYFLKWKNYSKDLSENSKMISNDGFSSMSQETDRNRDSHTLYVPKYNNETLISSTSSDNYNGATYSNYSWSQHINELDVIIKIPENTLPKELNVNVLPNEISVKAKNQILLQGELCQACKHNDTVWSVSGNTLEIHIEKKQEMWWSCFITSEPKLDLSKIDCTRPFDELPEEAQAKIAELQWNQGRKQLGQPTMEEIKRNETLEKAWHAEGSPFTGPFDPSIVTFD